MRVVVRNAVHAAAVRIAPVKSRNADVIAVNRERYTLPLKSAGFSASSVNLCSIPLR